MKDLELEAGNGTRTVTSGDISATFKICGRDKDMNPYPHVTFRLGGKTIDCFNFNKSQFSLIEYAFSRISKMMFPHQQRNALKEIRDFIN